MGAEDDELFRLVQRFPRHDGSAAELAYGPYGTLAAARGVRTRELRWCHFEGSVFTIERAPVVWEVVE